MADSVLRDKAKQFAKDIVFLCREIKSSHKEAVLVNQLLRSATSIGANLHEGQYAQSKNDFISSFSRYLSRFEIQVLDLYLDGLSYSEIGESCGKTAKSVDNAVQRIRNKLARHLNLGDFS